MTIAFHPFGDICQSPKGLARKNPYWYILNMDVPVVIRGLLEITGWTQAKLAERLGVGQNDVSRWLKGREPRGHTMEAIRSLASQHGLLEDAGRRQSIPVMGYVGAGGDVDPDYEQVPFDGLEQIELPQPIGLLDDPVGFIVRGESMMPRYNDGDVVLVEREPQRSFQSLIGDEAVITTHTGRRYLKKIMPTDRRGHYKLVSVNAPTIEATIRWASPVRIIIPSVGLKKAPKKRTGAVREHDARPAARKSGEG